MIKRLALTLSSTWIFVLSYYLKQFSKNDTFGLMKNSKILENYYLNHPLRLIALIIGTLIMIIVPVVLMRARCEDYIERAKLIELVDNNFVPSYLGYFFVSMSVDNYAAMLIFYGLIYIFVYFSGAEYFNPVFLFCRYHFYKVESSNGVQNIIILKSQSVVRKSTDLNHLQVNRINNLTYIGRK